MAKKNEEEIEEMEEESEESKEKKLPTLEELDPQVKFVLMKINEYLTEEANADKLFKAKFQDKSKSLVQCWAYICNKARSSNQNPISSQTMFRWAKDYYNDGMESGMKNEVAKGTLMTENAEEDQAYESSLSEEDKNKALERAKKQATEEYQRNLKKFESVAKNKEIKRLEEETKAKKLHEEVEKPKIEKKPKKESKQNYETISLFDLNSL